MSGQNTSAEIFEINDARVRLRAPEIDPGNFPSVGSYLEAVRGQQNLSLPALSERTHIKASYLEAIEQMAVERLPNRAYGVGFVRAYADALGLEPEPVIERFKAEAGLGGSHKPAPARRQPDVHAAAATAERPDPPRLSLLAVLAIIAFMIWCALSITQPRQTATPLKLDRVPLRPAPDGAAILEAAAAVAAPAAPAPAPGTVEAQVLERIEPVYPPECEAEAKANEAVTLAFTITPGGAVVSERVSSTTNPCFDRAALNALKRWRFSPRTVDGSPRPAFEQQVTLRFDRPR